MSKQEQNVVVQDEIVEQMSMDEIEQAMLATISRPADPNLELLEKIKVLDNTSSRMRYLVAHFNGSVKDAHKWLNQHYPRPDGKAWLYQHVRQVWLMPIKTKS